MNAVLLQTMILLSLILVVATTAYNFEDCTGTPKSLAHIHRINGKLHSYTLDYFHQQRLPYGPMYTFTDVFLQTNLSDPETYSFYQGEDCSTVLAHYENDNRYFGLLRRAAILRSHQLYPFNDTVVGVSTSMPYEISVQIWKVNYIRLVVFLGAILLFLLASSLVRNVVFYYTSGCSFGLLASLLLVAFIVWRVAPKKTIGVPILIGGWSVSLYMLHFAWSNLQSILVEYQKYVIGYFATVLMVSMAVCYKRGPPTDARSHDIAQWTLQLLALALVYFSSQVVEVSLATIGLLITQSVLRGYIFQAIKWYFIGLRSFWSRAFPKTRKLLTEEEYEEEGRRTTREQLDLLKQYCQNERNRPWKLAGNVRSTRRLARFVEGETNHITEDELYAHEMTRNILERVNDESNTFREDEEDEEEWDEVVVLRRNGNQNGSAVRSVRVPSDVTSRLLSPYERANKTYNAGSSIDRRGGDYEHGERMFPELSSRSPIRNRRPMTELRPPRVEREEKRFDLHELEALKQKIERRKKQAEREQLLISSANSRKNLSILPSISSRKSTSSTISSSESRSHSNARKRSPKKSITRRRAAFIDSDSEDNTTGI